MRKRISSSSTAVTIQSARIDAKRITDEDSFPKVFAEAMGFPSFYGENMDAWIDCLGYLDEPGTEMSRFQIPKGGMLRLEIADSEDLQRRLPEVFQVLIECTALVNRRRADAGGPPVLSLILL